MPGFDDEMADALYRGITGNRSRSSEGRSIVKRVAALEKATGSRAAAAKLIGVSAETLRRWVKGGQQPTGANASKLRAAARRLALSPTREARLRKQPVLSTGKRDKRGKMIKNRHRMVIRGTIRVSGDSRDDRKIDVGDYIPKEVIGDILDAWLAGNDSKAVDLLMAAIHEHYVDGMEIEQVNTIKFE